MERAKTKSRKNLDIFEEIYQGSPINLGTKAQTQARHFSSHNQVLATHSLFPRIYLKKYIKDYNIFKNLDSLCMVPEGRIKNKK